MDENEAKLPELCEQVTQELRKREDELQTDINLLDQPFLIKFIRACQYKLEYCAQVIINYFQMRKEHPELFRTVDECPNIRVSLKSCMFIFCDKLNEKRDNCRILYFRPGKR